MRRVRLLGLAPCTNSISRWLRSPQQGYDKYWFGVSATGSALYGNATSTNVQTAHGVAFGFDVLPPKLISGKRLRSPVSDSGQNDWVVYATGSSTSGGLGKPVSADFRVAFGFSRFSPMF